MDKLQPLIKHKFWILLVLALAIPVVGWWMGTGKVKAEITAREEAIKKAFSAPGAITPESPNQTWSAHVDLINVEKEKSINVAEDVLYQQQLKLQVWPSSLSQYMKNLKYREQAPKEVTGLYRNVYTRECYRLLTLLEPYNLANGSGKIYIDVPKWNEPWSWKDGPFRDPIVDLAGVNQGSPTSQEIWDAQEDIWLLESLFEAVARVNKSQQGIDTAPIKQITTFMLKGGNYKALEEFRKGGTPAAPGTTPGASPEMGPSPFASPFAQSRTSEQGTGTGKQTPIDFEPALDFGSDVPALATTTGAPGEMSPGPTATPFAQPGFGDFGNKKKNLLRYVHDDPAVPYRTRGFYIKLTMVDSNVPDLITELRNSKWPVTITRVHRAAIHQDPVSTEPGTGSEQTPFRPAANQEIPFRPVSPSTPGTGTTTAQTAMQQAQAKLESAMLDPFLVEVVIAGWMTLYNAPQAQPVPTTDPLQPLPTTPTVTPTQPTTPTTDPTVPATTPADPLNPTDPATTPVDPLNPATTPADPLNPTPPVTNPADPLNPATPGTDPLNPANPTVPETIPANPLDPGVPPVNNPEIPPTTTPEPGTQTPPATSQP